MADELMRDLLAEDGENRALRTFLMQYSCDRSVSVATMAQHMSRSGWSAEYWPHFARQVDNAGKHLTKAGAQLWIRHLLNMERRATPPSPSTAPTAGAQGGHLEPHKSAETRMDNSFQGGHFGGADVGKAVVQSVSKGVTQADEEAIELDFKKYSKWCAERSSRPMSFNSFREHEIERIAMGMSGGRP
jgi:hypothetical protein